MAHGTLTVIVVPIHPMLYVSVKIFLVPKLCITAKKIVTFRCKFTRNSLSPCGGKSLESRKCERECCKKTEGGWTSWSDWGVCKCDHTDGSASHSRTRTCTNPPPSCDGRLVQGLLLTFPALLSCVIKICTIYMVFVVLT